MKESGIGSQKIIRRKRDGELEYLPDDLTIEEPLEIRVGRKPIATTMRTPGHDEELAAGFLLSEGIVRTRDQIASISVSGDNRVSVELTAGVKLKLNSTKRFGTISSSCGLCGKTSIDAIRQNFPAIRSTDIRIDIETLLSLPEKLRNAQSDFARTGGIHAAGIFSVDGKLKIAREDIGRHNAVDKAVGRAFLDELLPLERHLLLVSGRASFEIIQKALAARNSDRGRCVSAFKSCGRPRARQQPDAHRFFASAVVQHLHAYRARDFVIQASCLIRQTGFPACRMEQARMLVRQDRLEVCVTSARQKPIPGLDRKFFPLQSNRSG